MKDKNSILWQKVNKSVIRATHFKVIDINPGLIYEFKVAAENAAGIGEVSKISDAVLAIDACGMCIFSIVYTVHVIYTCVLSKEIFLLIIAILHSSVLIIMPTFLCFFRATN